VATDAVRDWDAAAGRYVTTHVPRQDFGPLSPPRTAALLAIVAALGAWVVVGSSWAGGGGAASLLGLLALDAVVLPLVTLHGVHPYAFLTRRDDVAWGAFACAALGLLVTVPSYALGRRFLARAGPGVLAGLGLSLAASLVAGGVAWASAARWLDFGPASEGARIESFAFEGEGGRFLYANVHRGHRWSGGTAWDGGRRAEGPASPSRPFAIDLVEGTARPIGELGEVVTPPQGTVPTNVRAPLPWVTVANPVVKPLDVPVVRWVDARTGEVRLVATGHRAPDETLPWARATARAATPWRDAKGRAVWTVDARVEREGEAPSETRRRLFRGWVVAGPGGWTGAGEGRDFRLSAESGALEERPWAPRYVDGREAGESLDLGGGVYLARGVAYDPDRKPGDETWRLVGPEAGTETRAPLREGDEVTLPLLDGRVLLLEAAGEGVARLVAWDWEAGTRTPVSTTDPSLASLPRPAVVAASWWRPDGRLLLALQSARDRAGQAIWALLDPATLSLSARTPWFPATANPLPVQAVALDGDELLAIEDERRVVRFARGGAERSVLFPKEGP
jgi:hypothetical protein